MKIVIDSSVWLAGIGSQTGFASEIIFKSYKSSQIEIFTSGKILEEIVKNLEEKLKFDKTLSQKARIIVKNLCDFEMEITHHDIKNIRFQDPDDRHILALCHKVKADYLVTFDRKHLLPLKKYNMTRILEPRDFNEYLG